MTTTPTQRALELLTRSGGAGVTRRELMETLGLSYPMAGNVLWALQQLGLAEAGPGDRGSTGGRQEVAYRATGRTVQ